MKLPYLSITHHAWSSQCGDVGEFEGRLSAAAAQCLEEILKNVPQGEEHVLSSLREVEISLVDDAVIADVHERFLNDPTPTDVITFPYGDGVGEILISVTTGERHAKAYQEPVDREIFRYLVHGLLHLHGYLDATEEQRHAMFIHQERLVEKFWH